jgi:chromosomal replication initiation ATPase DnaA
VTQSPDRDDTPIQLSLEFPRPALDLDALATSPSNAGALARLKQARSWPVAAMALIGPPCSGLTSLSQAWAEHFDGCRMTPEAFDSMSQAALDARAAQVTAIDPASAVKDEMRLLWLINQVGGRGGRLLLTGYRSPTHWPVSLKDLASRLRSMPVAEIGLPDDAMMRARLMAACDRYFFRLPEDVANFLVLRLPRSYSGLEDYVRRLAGTVTGTGRELTVPLAREVLRLELADDDDDTDQEEQAEKGWQNDG